MEVRRLAIWAAVAATLSAGAALAQEEVRPERLYLNNSGVLLGSTRVIALGGAYVGVAEGVSGFASNLASLAHRAPDLDRDWDVGFTLSYLDLPFVSPRDRDLDNDRARDNADQTRQLLGGILLQYKRFGIGWYFRTSSLWYCASAMAPCPAGDHLTVSLGNTALAAAVALGRDDFIAGLGLYGAEASLAYGREDRRYTQTGVEFDVLYRPHGLNYRVGVSVKPQVVGHYLPRSGEAPVLASRRLYEAIVSPAVISLGGSMRLGDGSWNYNRLSPAARRDIAQRFGEGWLPAETPTDAPAGRWLLTGQLDLISGTENTVSIQSFVDPGVAQGTLEPTPAGRDTYLAPRLGVEAEAIPGRFRARLGAYIEPSPFRDIEPRAHFTGGFEVFVYEYWEKWSLSSALDFASRYYNVGVSIGFWR